MSVHRKWLLGLVGVVAFAALSAALYRGYLTPEMLLYYASFKWCF